MNKDIRKEITPQEYIRKLFADTKDGKLEIKYFPLFDQQYSHLYKMDWLHEDAENMVQRYNSLIAALNHIGELHDKLQDEETRLKLLSAEELDVWNTYISPFEPFETDLDIIADLYFCRETDSLEDDENELLERHYEWFVENSRKRLPFDRCCPSQLINRVQRYEVLVRSNASESDISEEGCYLAEELVIYHHSIKKIEYDMLRFILPQISTYPKALEEIKRGKKKTHWMWYIFPQLRGLGRSEMSHTYGIVDSDEAETYLKHPVLGARLIEITTELLKLDENDPEVIFGPVDAMKLRSSMTLFAYISEADSVFNKVLTKFFDGKTDEQTILLIKKDEE